MTAAATFALGVTQGGVDVTSAISENGIEIRAVINGARTCRYTYEIIGGGSIDLTALVGASVVVTVNTGGGAETIFSGNINRTPRYDTDSRTLDILATDGWQEFLDGKIWILLTGRPMFILAIHILVSLILIHVMWKILWIFLLAGIKKYW